MWYNTAFPMFNGNFYEFMKPRFQKSFNNIQHFDKMFNVLLTRFVWDGLPENIPDGFLEGFLLTNGTVGMTKDKGELYVIPGSYAGQVKGYLPEEYCGVLPDVTPKQGKIGKDWAVGWNNLTRTPEFPIFQYANILAEIDVSEKCNVLFSRFIRIPKVKDEKEKTAVLDSIKNIFDGKFDAIVSDNIMSDIRQFMDAPGRDEPFLDLVDIKEIDKLQYLNQYRDNIVKRFFQIYGQKTQVTSKMAQMSNDEVHANDSLSLILSDEALQCREKFCEDCNNLFGLSMSVKYNECWQDEVDEMNNDDLLDNEEGGMDDAGEIQDSDGSERPADG